MEKNIGTANRVIRVIIGFAFLLIVSMAGFLDILLMVMALIGIILIATGILGTCPLYSLMKKGQASGA